LTGAFEQTDENPDRLPFNPDLAALLLEFARTQVKLEDPESNQTRGWHWSHCNSRCRQYRVYHCCPQWTGAVGNAIVSGATALNPAPGKACEAPVIAAGNLQKIKWLACHKNACRASHSFH